MLEDCQAEGALLAGPALEPIGDPVEPHNLGEPTLEQCTNASCKHGQTTTKAEAMAVPLVYGSAVDCLLMFAPCPVHTISLSCIVITASLFG